MLLGLLQTRRVSAAAYSAGSHFTHI